MPGLQQRPTVFAQDYRDTSTVKQHRIGTLAETIDGRRYRYSLAGGTDLDPGKLCVAETLDTDATNKTVARTYVAGATEVIIDAGGAVTADRYADGYLTINDATGEGVSHLVNSNTGTTGAAELTVTLDDPLAVALTIDVSEASLTANPWSGAVISVTDQLDMAIGVPNVLIDDADFGWLQTGGVCSVLADESFAIAQALTIGTGVAGAVEAADLIGEQLIGVAIVAGVDTEYREVFLSID